MPKKISKSSITDIGKNEFRTRMMGKVITHIKKDGSLHVPLLTLITCFIDGLAKGKKGETKPAYLNYIKKHFPELCKELGAEVFYNKYRNAAVHEFSIKKGYGIDRNSSMKGKYIDTQIIIESNKKLIVLNIDKLVDDFLQHIQKLRKKYKKTKK